MVLLNLSKAGLTASSPLFSNLDFTLHERDRVGIVAANGRGKSSLLQCIAGERELTTGDLTRARGLHIGYMPQNVPAHLQQLSFHWALLDGLSPQLREEEGWRADVQLYNFNVPEELHHRPVSELSGGWQRIMLIARAWISEPDVLLMDEPTNHLDLERILWLENWLASEARNTALLISSHDRAFLDRVTNATLFLRPEESQHFKLGYSRACEALDEIDHAIARQHERDLKEAQQLRRQAAKLNNIGINSGSDLLVVKTKQLKERANKIEQGARAAHKERHGTIKLANSGTHAKVLVTLSDMHVTRPDDSLLFSTGKHHIFQGDRIVLLGRNGTGKSRLTIAMADTLLKGAEIAGLKCTPSIEPGYMDQALEALPVGSTPHQVIAGLDTIGDQGARAVLADAGFSIEQQAMAVSKLSFGQRSRLLLLALRLKAPNFYLMDEPTNHIDIPGQEALEQEIVERGATCVLVSHDRSFIRAIGTRFWMIEGQKLVEHDSPEPFFASLGAN